MTKLAFSVAETAKLIGCSESMVYRAVANGELPTVPFVGRRVLIPAVALERVINETATFRATEASRPSSRGLEDISSDASSPNSA